MMLHPHQRDEVFMQRALELATLGSGHVSPNPLVGCVIVHNGLIIGEGWHKEYGGPHAEVNAINSVADKALLKESTLYVSLEPCSHFGKTPPCADLLIREQVKKIVIANEDPNPLVAGTGIRKLREHGIDVQTGILTAEGRELNKRFFTWMEKKRPYIILKWAQTSDGFIAKEGGYSKWISDEISRQLVHKWRIEEDAVMVGTCTAQNDNPLLNVRNWTGRNPVRVLIDRRLKLDTSLHLFDKSQKTLCYNLIKNEMHENLSFVKLGEHDFVQQLVDDLYQRQKIQSVIIEGGAQTLQVFIDAGLWDEARVFVSQKQFIKGIKGPSLSGELVDSQHLGTDLLKLYKPVTVI